MGIPSRDFSKQPLSPHLSIYRFTWTMAMSIAHRATGMACYAALPLFVVWLWAIADGPASYEALSALAGSWFGTLVLIGLSWATIHHLVGGIRHVIFDTGTGLGLPARMLWAKATLIVSVLLTILVWIAILAGGN